MESSDQVALYGPLGYLCFRFPSFGCWMSMPSAALIIPASFSDFWLTSNGIWLTSNGFLWTYTDFWITELQVVLAMARNLSSAMPPYEK